MMDSETRQTSPHDNVILSVSDGIAELCLNRPSDYNALSPALLGSLLQTVEAIATSPKVRVIILTGSPPAFCVGGDLRLVAHGQGLVDSEYQESLDRVRTAARISDRLRTSRAVTLAAVNGACAGAGLSLALSCDIRIAADTAVFNTAFLSAGAPGDLGGIWFATRLLGEAAARDIFLRPRRLTAPEALQLGLVTMVAEVDRVMDEARSLAAEWCGRDAPTLTAMKENLADAAESDLSEYLDREAARYVRNAQRGVGRAAAEEFLANSLAAKQTKTFRTGAARRAISDPKRKGDL